MHFPHIKYPGMTECQEGERHHENAGRGLSSICLKKQTPVTLLLTKTSSEMEQNGLHCETLAYYLSLGSLRLKVLFSSQMQIESATSRR